ncbi:TusE/DsrC/DsvC family sulfur relay protein [Microbulbifer agarilyticus]|uniref:TusE/DsrC/DsvC family sulfur relay protein n=1 Tax=Microbulbifer agarilyticus TaxID=260552 RepID=UPI001C96A664|nr:TusE/DsrC/DsvC family sulfur relay protein [Microbulbifer agarilyticus]MBY6189450.1 TusE/DsrC/DsvC family sulfur relay protein [Microbulbifer agarilyticus]
MNNLVIAGREIALDKEGFLRDLNDWTPDVATALATRENIELTQDHWDVIALLRDFYQEFELSPAMRPLVKYVGQHLGPEKGRSIFLMQLFPPSPAKIGSKIAGLPKPTNCL